VGPALLEPTRIYVKDVLALKAAVPVKGLAHITGSGLPGNVPRCLPVGTQAVLEEHRWTRAPIFDLLQQLGGVARDEMFSTFNMGLGMTVVVAPESVEPALRLLRARGLEAWEVGAIEASPLPEAEARVLP
jgi:phosphoribosylformylglycinamidine cyclo-ligase